MRSIKHRREFRIRRNTKIRKKMQEIQQKRGEINSQKLRNNIYPSMYVYMYICMYVCVSECMHVRMYVCMYLCMYAFYVCITQ